MVSLQICHQLPWLSCFKNWWCPQSVPLVEVPLLFCFPYSMYFLHQGAIVARSACLCLLLSGCPAAGKDITAAAKWGWCVNGVTRAWHAPTGSLQQKDDAQHINYRASTKLPVTNETLQSSRDSLEQAWWFSWARACHEICVVYKSEFCSFPSRLSFAMHGKSKLYKF